MGALPALTGYEIHAGITTGVALIKSDTIAEGAMSVDEQVLGTYLHGILNVLTFAMRY
jgi:adenosylcobyric acid synthase